MAVLGGGGGEVSGAWQCWGGRLVEHGSVGGRGGG